MIQLILRIIVDNVWQPDSYRIDGRLCFVPCLPSFLVLHVRGLMRVKWH